MAPYRGGHSIHLGLGLLKGFSSWTQHPSRALNLASHIAELERYKDRCAMLGAQVLGPSDTNLD